MYGIQLPLSKLNYLNENLSYFNEDLINFVMYYLFAISHIWIQFREFSHEVFEVLNFHILILNLSK